DADGRMDAEDSKVRFGQPGDVPVVGDWNGDGVEQLGIYRDGLWVLDLNGNREIDATDKVFEMGGAEDVPMAGDFDGDGVDEASLYRSTTRKAG
ncbi:MAG: fibrinogen-binding protein, partial [Planctomycetota bacterium]|nr:fibrinogen-binding protein [Planctomycetota bacterium]